MCIHLLCCNFYIETLAHGKSVLYGSNAPSKSIPIEEIRNYTVYKETYRWVTDLTKIVHGDDDHLLTLLSDL